MTKKKKLKSKFAKVGRRFFLKRTKDASGISGVGIVAFGIQMPTQKVIIEWLSDSPSEGIFNNIDELLKIHGHDGDTTIEWIDSLDLNFIY